MKVTPILLLAVATTLILSGCVFDEDDPKKSYVRIIHASSDAPPVDVRLGRSFEVEGLDYKQAVVFEPNAGNAQLSINADLTGSQRETLLSANYAFRQDKRYDFIAIGSVADGTIKPIALSDDKDVEIGSDVRLRVIHASPNAQAASANVDIYLTDADEDGDQWFAAGPDFRMGFEDVEGPQIVDAGRYKIRVARAGTTDVVFESGILSLDSGKNLLIAAVDNTAVNSVSGSASQSPISLMVLDGDGVSNVYGMNQRSGLRVVNFSPGNSPVEVRVDDQVLISDLAFAEVAPSAARNSYETVAPGTRNVKVTVAGSNRLTEDNLNLATGEGYTVIAYDRDSLIKSFVLKDSVRSIASQASMRVVHGSRIAAVAGPVNIFLLDEGQTSTQGNVPILREVPFGTETGYLPTTPGNYNLVIQDADGNVAIGPVGFSLEEGGIYTFIAGDNESGLRAELLALDDANSSP